MNKLDKIFVELFTNPINKDFPTAHILRIIESLICK